mmetsp:Transcript_58448/g.169586  ORF Transcript_58448/g.169586 Transcript_58448/m.169586 type:complete len:117 (+) Transcript_58448:3-353(+)
MIFGAMCLGDAPTLELVREVCGGPERAAELEATPQGRGAIRSLVRTKFDVRRHSGFGDLDTDVQELIAGLLAGNPGQRWSATGALSFAQRLAAERGIKLPPPREAPRLPPDWLDWQ